MQVRNVAHALMPVLTDEDRSRQKAVIALRRAIHGQVRSKNIARYEADGAPAFEAKHGRRPQSPDDIEQAFFESHGYRIWSALNRASQELIWTAVGEPILRDGPRLEQAAADLAADPAKKGELHLDPAFIPPAEIADVDIHLQPGGYMLDRHPGDVLAGALYENGGNIYAFGMGIGKGDSKAAAVIRYLEGQSPGFKPKRVLDIGCSAGAASCGWAAHFPEAEIHAIDLGTATLRYAHARAEALGVRVIFHQMDAAKLSFPDGFFDAVVSHNLLHEIGSSQRAKMMAEAWRVLAPGGVVVHQDVPVRFEPTLVEQVERAWDTRFNAEPFWKIYGGDDLMADMRAAGVDAQSLKEVRLPKLSGPGDWYLLLGAKPRSA